MKNYDEILSEIEEKIIYLKEKNVHSYYNFSVEITKEVAIRLKKHFELGGYNIIVNKCPRNFFDIIIGWQ